MEWWWFEVDSEEKWMQGAENKIKILCVCDKEDLKLETLSLLNENQEKKETPLYAMGFKKRERKMKHAS